MPCPGSTTCPLMLENAMMLPEPRSAMPRPKSRIRRKVPFRFSSTTRSNSSSVISSTGFLTLTEGVLTSTSGTPTDSTAALMLSWSVISSSIPSASPPSVLISLAVFCAASPSISAHTTLAPKAASPCALASPIPLPAPTTSTLLPERSNMERKSNMGFLSVGVVHRRRGVELAGGEEFLFIDPLVCVVWDLAVPRSRRDDGYACPRMQERAVGRTRYPVVGRLFAGEAGVGPCHRADQRLLLRGFGRRALFDHLERSVEVRVFRGQPGEDVFQTRDELSVGLGWHCADIQGDVGARRDHVDLGFPAIRAHEDSRREARISEERVLAVALDLLSFEFLDRDDEPCGPRNGVDTTSRHGTVRHHCAHGKFRPERALLTCAELVLLGFADNGGVHSFCVASLDERLDACHHPLFVYRMTEYQPAGERDTRAPYRGHGRSQVPLGVARPTPVDTVSSSLGVERRVIPVLRAALRHHVRVRLEEQGLPRPVALPHGTHVRTSRDDFFDPHLEARVLQMVRDESGDARLVPVLLFRTVDARDADEFARQVHEFPAVDVVQYIVEHSLESGVRSCFDVRLRQPKPANSTVERATRACSRLLLAYSALRPISLQALLDGVQELEGGSAVEDAVVEGDLEVHHAADGDGVFYHDGAFDDGFRGEDRRLRVIDDGRRDHAAEGAGVVDGEGSVRDVCGAELADAGAPHPVIDLAGEPEDVQLVGIGNNGDDQGVFEVDGHADVYSLSQDYAVPVPHGVEYGIHFETLDNGLYYERQVGQLYALALGEGILLPPAQRDEPAHVHLDHGPGVRSFALARGHAVGYGAPDATQVLDTVALVEG